jgi:hypothetical protein
MGTSAYVEHGIALHQVASCLGFENWLLVAIAYTPIGLWLLVRPASRTLTATVAVLILLPTILLTNCVSDLVAIEILAHIPLALLLISEKMRLQVYGSIIFISLTISSFAQLVLSGKNVALISNLEWTFIFSVSYLTIFLIGFWLFILARAILFRFKR